MPAVEIVTFFLQTGWVAKIVLVTLIIFSLASWSVILGKWRELGAARKASDRFLKVFRDAARLNEAAATASKHRVSPLAGMFQAGYTELEAQIRTVRRDVEPPSEAAAAWGQPPVILRCGVEEPTAVDPTQAVLEVGLRLGGKIGQQHQRDEDREAVHGPDVRRSAELRIAVLRAANQAGQQI